jgi:hypothetical protein
VTLWLSSWSQNHVKYISKQFAYCKLSQRGQVPTRLVFQYRHASSLLTPNSGSEYFGSSIRQIWIIHMFPLADKHFTWTYVPLALSALSPHHCIYVHGGLFIWEIEFGYGGTHWIKNYLGTSQHIFNYHIWH